jgi:hypothetical protein
MPEASQTPAVSQYLYLQCGTLAVVSQYCVDGQCESFVQLQPPCVPPWLGFVSTQALPGLHWLLIEHTKRADAAVALTHVAPLPQLASFEHAQR